MSNEKTSYALLEQDLNNLLLYNPDNWASVLAFRTELLAIYNRAIARQPQRIFKAPTLATWA
jgi:hypothetical protein